MIKPIFYTNQTAEELFGRRAEEHAALETTVQAILNDVKENGDEAIKKYSLKFDGFDGDFTVSEQEFERAFAEVSEEYVAMLKRAIQNIRAFHQKQLRKGFEIEREHCIIGQKVTAVDVAGVYVPGGTAAYPSTVLMNVIPAKIAGVKKIVMVTPVKADGKVKSEVLVAARLSGADVVLKMGGAQAIAALAYGTQTVPKADKITGPGNAYVATAKKLVYGVCGIDMIAGPSEILVVADENANSEHVAADMLSQAEHDKLASALLITNSEKLAKEVDVALERRVKQLPREEIAMTSLKNNGKIIVCNDLKNAVTLANSYAPEHLELCVKEPFVYLDSVKNAGSVFLGYNTPEAVGDYYGGANHTLPTSGTARFSSPLGVEDFLKTTQYIYYTPEALDKAADDIAMFAYSEGLAAHAQSVEVRKK
jgi:histidinol dehydrogenase